MCPPNFMEIPSEGFQIGRWQTVKLSADIAVAAPRTSAESLSKLLRGKPADEKTPHLKHVCGGRVSEGTAVRNVGLTASDRKPGQPL